MMPTSSAPDVRWGKSNMYVLFLLLFLSAFCSIGAQIVYFIRLKDKGYEVQGRQMRVVGRRTSTPFLGKAKAAKFGETQEDGGPPGTRTLNQLIKSQLLCQLS